MAWFTIPVVFSDGSVLTASDLNTTVSTIANGTVGVANGGTGLAAGATGSLGYFSSASAMTTLAIGTTGQALIVSGGLPAWGTLGVAGGGTGQTSYTNGQLLIGNTAGNTLAKATLTAGTGVTVTNGAGAITLATDLSASRTVSPATVTSVGVETDLWTITVPANTLSTNRMIRVTLLGSMTNNVGTAQIVDVKMYYGTTVFFTTVGVSTTLASGATAHPVRMTALLSARNATNAQIGYGQLDITTASGVAGTAGRVAGDTGTATATLAQYAATHTTMAEDSTGALTMKITATPTTNSSSLSLTATVVQVELV